MEIYARVADHLRQPLYQWWVPLYRATRALMAGRMDEAEQHNAQTAAVAERAGSDNGRFLASVQRVGLLLERGDREQAQRVQRSVNADALSGNEDPTYARAMDLATTAFLGEEPEAGAALRRIDEERLADQLPKDSEW